MARLQSWIEGNRAIVQATFRVPDEAGTLTDPTTVTFTARRRRGKTIDAATEYVYLTDAEVVRVSVGVFKLTIDPLPGDWHVHVQGTGACHAAGEAEFTITAARALE